MKDVVPDILSRNPAEGLPTKHTKRRGMKGERSRGEIRKDMLIGLLTTQPFAGVGLFARQPELSWLPPKTGNAAKTSHKRRTKTAAPFGLFPCHLPLVPCHFSNRRQSNLNSQPAISLRLYPFYKNKKYPVRVLLRGGLNTTKPDSVRVCRYPDGNA